MNAKLPFCGFVKTTLFFVAMIFVTQTCLSQTTNNDTLARPHMSIGVQSVNGETIPVYMLEEIVVVGKCVFKSEKEKAKYTKLVRDIKKTLPYARLCKQQLDEIDRTLNGLQGQDEKALYLKNAEKALFTQFEKPLKKLTYNQGRLLIKLIDRETGNTSYNLIKDFKGGFSAFVWQSVARMFGSNLKSEYDGLGEDMAIESIIYFIDKGVY